MGNIILTLGIVRFYNRYVLGRYLPIYHQKYYFCYYIILVPYWRSAVATGLTDTTTEV